MSKQAKPAAPASNSRRQLLQGLLLGAVASAKSAPALAMKKPLVATTTGTAEVITGPEVDLVIGQSSVNFTGKSRTATTINGSLPAPTLRFKEGDEVTIRVTNTLNVPTSIHWHGIILPYQMDGVPGVSFDGIAPGETFVYKFTLQQSGTYWYHSHSGFQKMTGLYGALIIEPKEGELYPVDRDHIVQLSDWSDEDPMRVFSKLKIQSDLYNFNQPTAFDFFNDVSNGGVKLALAKRRMWNQMRMNPSDLADLSATTLSFLINGQTTDTNWTAIAKLGERVRLRFINTSSNTLFDVRIPDLAMQIVQADGQNVEPISIDEFRFGPGETYDAIIEPINEAHTLFAQSIDRSGFVRASIASQQGLEAPIPTLDPAVPLSMIDMMGDMAPPAKMPRHASSEYGATVDARVDTPPHEPGRSRGWTAQQWAPCADPRRLASPSAPAALRCAEQRN